MVLTQPVPPRVIVVSPRRKPRIAPARNSRTIVGPSSSAVDDELAQALIAWKRYQSTRKRDAIYDYLQVDMLHGNDMLQRTTHFLEILCGVSQWRGFPPRPDAKLAHDGLPRPRK